MGINPGPGLYNETNYRNNDNKVPFRILTGDSNPVSYTHLQEVGFKLGEQHQNVTYYQDYTIMRYADVLLMHSELNGNADGLNQDVYKRQVYYNPFRKP